MPEREDILDKQDKPSPIEKAIHTLTQRYVNGLDGLPNSRLLRVRSNHSGFADMLGIKNVGERVVAEKDKFDKRFKDFVNGFIKYSPPGETDSHMPGFVRTACIHAGADLVSAANQRFGDFPYFRSPILQSARGVFLYGAKVSQVYEEEIDPDWLNEFMLNVVMQSPTDWRTGGKEEFPDRVVQFREPNLTVPNPENKPALDNWVQWRLLLIA